MVTKIFPTGVALCNWLNNPIEKDWPISFAPSQVAESELYPVSQEDLIFVGQSRFGGSSSYSLRNTSTIHATTKSDAPSPRFAGKLVRKVLQCPGQFATPLKSKPTSGLPVAINTLITINTGQEC